MSVLILRLEGVLQSWGEQSKWDYRDSSTMPTKSGVIGILGCALGLVRESPECVELFNRLTMAIRADRSGSPLVDFHTVTAEKLLTSSGVPKSGGNTIVTNRTYLQDACFMVFISGERILLERLAGALQKPKWPIFLGRKSCVPSSPVFCILTDDYSDLDSAMKNFPLSSRCDKQILFETEADCPDGVSLLRLDVSEEGYRKFKRRQVFRGILMEA